jgi:uncharacterized protein (DUF1330 family)
MSAYFVGLIDIHDPEAYDKYLEGFDEIFARFEGQVVAVEDSPRVLEGTWPAGRIVLIRFPSEEQLRRWYESREYQAIAEHRRRGSHAAIAIVTGRD